MENTLIASLITVDNLIVGVMFFALITISYIYKHLPANVKEVRHLKAKKQKQEKLIYITLRELENITDKMDSLINDLESVKLYNQKNISELKIVATRCEALLDYIQELEDPNLETDISEIIRTADAAAKHIESIETQTLMLREKFQHMQNYNHAQYKSCALSDKDFVTNLNLNKNEIITNMNLLKSEREKIYILMKETKQLHTKTQEEMYKYIKDKIQHKKLKLKLLTYI